MAPLGETTWGWSALSLAPLLYLAVLAHLAREAPELRVDPAALTIRWGERRWAFPLEELRYVADAIGGVGRSTLAGEEVPPLRVLTLAERAWLVALIEHHAARRKIALMEQGHDLSAPGSPPPELLDGLERA